MARTYGASRETPEQAERAREQQRWQEFYQGQELDLKRQENQARAAQVGQTEADREMNTKLNLIKSVLGLREQEQYRTGQLNEAKQRELDRNATVLISLSQNPALQDWDKASPQVKAVLGAAAKTFDIDLDKVAPNQKFQVMQQAVAQKGGQVPGVPAGTTAPPTNVPVPAAAGGPTGGAATAATTAAQQPTQPSQLDQLTEQLVKQFGGGGQPESPAEKAQREAFEARTKLASAGPVHYDPELGANVRTAADGSRFVVGAGDPSVGALAQARAEGRVTPYGVIGRPAAATTAAAPVNVPTRETMVPSPAPAPWETQAPKPAPFAPANLVRTAPAPAPAGTPPPAMPSALPAPPPGSQGTMPFSSVRMPTSAGPAPAPTPGPQPQPTPAAPGSFAQAPPPMPPPPQQIRQPWMTQPQVTL